MKRKRKELYDTFAPLVICEETWTNCHLSIARHYGGVNYRDHEYLIVDKHGRDLWECTAIAEKEGREKAIEPGEPADLCRRDFIPTYRKLGRDRVFELIREGKTEKEIKDIANPKKAKK